MLLGSNVTIEIVRQLNTEEMNNLENLKEYLRQIAQMRRDRPKWRYNSPEALVLDLAQPFERIPTPPDLAFFNEPKECYRNCAAAAALSEGYYYTEGYWIPSHIPIPIEHAWLVSNNGKAIDPTDPGEGGIYFGVPLERSWLIEAISSRRSYPLILRGHFDDNHFLRHGLPRDAIVHLKF